MGYARAGFDVTGIDVKPQPNYPFRFIQADALNPPVDLSAFDVIHASPPCQAYSQATAWRGSRDSHPDLIDDVRAILEAAGVPYVIENVMGARSRLRQPWMLCGSQFGLRVQRHRYFEAPTIPFALLHPCDHAMTDIPFDHGGTFPESKYRTALDCEWMTVQEARQAVPPAYTHWIGSRIMESLTKEFPPRFQGSERA